MIPTVHNYEDPEMPLLSIGAASSVLGVSINTLRLYESEGLILPARTQSNQRRYSRLDLARIACIRHAIQNEGMTINAIKRMIAMIPCWEIMGCIQADRERCPAFTRSEKPCWAYKHESNACSETICRECTVYKLASDCDSIKATIVNSTRKL